MALEPESTLSVDVWRGTAVGKFQTFAVPRRAHQTILDVVTEIQREQDATLSYRFACRVGMCGSCAMAVNGRPRWTCRTRVSEAVADDGSLRLEPLRNFTVVKDLAVEMTDFFDKWRDAKGHFEPGSKLEGRLSCRAALDAREESRRRRHRMHRMRRLPFGLRRGRRGTRTISGLRRSTAPGPWSTTCVMPATMPGIAAVSGSAGCHACHSHMNCTEFCPRGIAPTYSIAGLKRAMMKRALGGRVP